MTASRNKASRAVTAALVGVLSVGAVPMVAVAAETASGAVTLAASAYDNFAAGEVTIARDGNNAAIDLSETPEFEVGASNCGITVVEVKLGDGTTATTGFEVIGYAAWSDEDSDGEVDEDEVKITSTNFPTTAGTYVAVVTGSQYDNAVIYLPFKVVNHSLQGAYVCDVDSNGELDADDATVTYNGTTRYFYNYDLGIALDGEVLDYGVDYTRDLKVYDSNGNQVQGVTDAGTYTVVIQGADDYEGSNVSVQFEVEPLNLAAADIEIAGLAPAVAYNGDAIAPATGSPSKVDDLAQAHLSDLVVVANDGVAQDLGTYTYTVRVADGASDAVRANYEGEGTYTMDVVESVAQWFEYDGVEFTADNMGAYATIDLSDEDHFVFDEDDVTVKADEESATVIDPDYVEVVVVDRETGEQGGAEMLSQPGDYYVTIRVDAEAAGYAWGGSSETVEFKVIAGTVSSADIYVTYKGVTDDEGKAEYTGRDYLGDLTILVRDANGDVVPSTEYDVVVTDEDGNEVDSIVDAGTYKVGIVSDSYEVAEESEYTFTVTPVELYYKVDWYGNVSTNVMVDGTFADRGFLPYTGEVLDPGYLWLSAGADGLSGNEDDEWLDLSTGVYTVTYLQDGKEAELREPGDYTAHIVVSDPDGNFTAVVIEVPVTVSDQKVYADVPNDAWYAEVVYEANDMGYMTGYADGTFFGPMDSLSRADAVVVLWNMAGEPDGTPSEGSSGNLVYDTPYGDTDDSAYYAQALQWATKLGIVAGDGDAQESFRPSASVTREEFAKMLYVYEQLQGNVEGDVDEDEILSAYTDADSVSEWAEEYVAWLVDQGVMGVDTETINGNGTIVRAEVAAMVVRVQPGGQLDDFMTSKPDNGQ